MALYATCTGRNVSPDAAGGCPRSPSADVSALRKRSARCGASLQRLTTGSPPFRLAYWSCRARLGVLGSGRTCGRPRPRSQTAHPLGFGRSDGRRRLLRYRTDVEYLANRAATSRVNSMQHQRRDRTTAGPISSMVLPPQLTPPQGRWPHGQPHVQPPHWVAAG